MNATMSGFRKSSEQSTNSGKPSDKDMMRESTMSFFKEAFGGGPS